MTDDIRYMRTWRRLAVLQCLFAVLFIGYLPAMAILFSYFPDWPKEKIFFGWGIPFLIVAIALTAVRCPRCGEFFVWGWNRLYRNPFAQKCIHCRQPAWQMPKPEEATREACG